MNGHGASAAGNNGHLSPGAASSTATFDQACKECRRRKSRCNRTLPHCDQCIRYKRQCLYEKPTRTPLTRKHLTEVERRLERSERLLTETRNLVPPHLRTWERQSTSEHDSAHSDQARRPTGQTRRVVPRQSQRQHRLESLQSSSESSPPTFSALSRECLLSVDTAASRPETSGEAPKSLEGPPPGKDFEWSERESTPPSHGPSPDSVLPEDEDSHVTDGMACFNVDEQEVGYLGVASGAAILRLLDPSTRHKISEASARPASRSRAEGYSLTPQPNPNTHIAETIIDAYFRLYHVNFPILHEPTFRAQYSEIIPRPRGPCWSILAYIVAAIGVWTSAKSPTDTLDLNFFSRARSMLNFDFLQMGSLSLLQALTLASNYVQKRNKPNSGYNYLGLAVRMAMGLGLHKEFPGWNISPLRMEVRRRVWWALCVFDVGATITFSRPDVWPYKGVEVAFPMNIGDKDLTAASTSYPAGSNEVTIYTAIATQARFHVATHECYERVISDPLPSANELFTMESMLLDPWQAAVPVYFKDDAIVPSRYSLAHAIMRWRLRNLRIIMYRSFVIRRAMLRQREEFDQASTKAFDKCLLDAKATIQLISEYWAKHEHNRLSAWYALYFLFQAALIPCICLRNDPAASMAPSWREQITTTLQTITSISEFNTSGPRSHKIIMELCGAFLNVHGEDRVAHTPPQQPTHYPHNKSRLDGEELGTATGVSSTFNQMAGQDLNGSMNNVFAMMWPNIQPMDTANVAMGDDSGWMEFLQEGSDTWNIS